MEIGGVRGVQPQQSAMICVPSRMAVVGRRVCILVLRAPCVSVDVIACVCLWAECGRANRLLIAWQ